MPPPRSGYSRPLHRRNDPYARLSAAIRELLNREPSASFLLWFGAETGDVQSGTRLFTVDAWLAGQAVRPSRDLITEIIASCFYHADTHDVRSIAFPLLGTGAMRFPRDVCLDTMFQFLARMFLRGLTSVTDARIALYKDEYTSGQGLPRDHGMQAIQSPWERALMAAEKVKERLRRATKALDDAGIPYAVAGGNAVAEWVARVDEDAVRNTKDVDILIRRGDFDAVRAALEAAGFVHRRLLDIEVFVDGPAGRPSAGVRLLFFGERVKQDDQQEAPVEQESELSSEFQVVSLEALVRMKLVAYRLKDRVHLLDLIAVGQIDAMWPARFPPPLGDRLQQLLDNPNG